MRNLEVHLFNALGPLVAGRVHPVIVPEGATFPCIRYALASGTRDASLCGDSGLLRSDVQIDIYAKEFAEVRTLREAVIAAMLLFPLEVVNTMELDAFESDVKMFRRMLQYSIAEQEGP
jgi:hypothetical protein